MKQLFRFEFRKVLKSRFFYVSLICCLGYLLLSNISNLIDPAAYLEQYGENANNLGNYGFLPQVDLAIYIGISFFLVFYLTRDNANLTTKNIFGRGITRTQFYFARVVVATFFSTLIFVLYYLLAYLFSGSIIGEFSIVDTSGCLKVIGFEYGILVIYVCFACFVCSVFKKTGGAMAVMLVSPIFVLLILGGLNDLLYLAGISENFDLCDYWFFTYEWEITGFLDFAPDTNYYVIRRISLVDWDKYYWTLFGSIAVFGGFGYLIAYKEEI